MRRPSRGFRPRPPLAAANGPSIAALRRALSLGPDLLFGVGGLKEDLEGPLFAHLLAGDRDRVLPGQATETDVFPGVLQRGDEPFHGEISERIRIDEVCDLRHCLLVRDELVSRLHVDSEITREANGQTADANVDFL